MPSSSHSQHFQVSGCVVEQHWISAAFTIFHTFYCLVLFWFWPQVDHQVLLLQTGDMLQREAPPHCLCVQQNDSKLRQWHHDVLPEKPKLPTTLNVHTNIHHVTVWQGLVSPAVTWQRNYSLSCVHTTKMVRRARCVCGYVYFPGLTYSSLVCQDQVCVDFLLLLLHFQAKHHLGLPAHRGGRRSGAQFLLRDARDPHSHTGWVSFCECFSMKVSILDKKWTKGG